MESFLIITTVKDLVRIAPSKLVYIISEGNYSNIVFMDGSTILVTMQLGQIEALIEKQLKNNNIMGSVFIRIGKSLIINRNYIHYIHISKQKLILSDTLLFSYEVSASKEALRTLKEFIEMEINQS